MCEERARAGSGAARIALGADLAAYAVQLLRQQRKIGGRPRQLAVGGAHAVVHPLPHLGARQISAVAASSIRL
jgi:hypothetical protein